MTAQPLSVYAVDITSSGISAARLVEGAAPKCSYAPIPMPSNFAPTTLLPRFEKIATKGVDGVLAGGLPTLVLLNKLTLDDQHSDKSGPSRAGLWWAVARELIDAGLPLTEAPPLFSAAKLFTNAVGGIKPSTVHEQARPAAQKLWPELELPAAGKFRAITTIYAAAGVMRLGGTTPIRLTDARKQVIDMIRLPGENSVSTKEIEEAS